MTAKPPLILAELVERRTRLGHPIYIGRANGLRVVLVHHEERVSGTGERVQVWRLVAQPSEPLSTSVLPSVLPRN